MFVVRYVQYISCTACVYNLNTLPYIYVRVYLCVYYFIHNICTAARKNATEDSLLTEKHQQQILHSNLAIAMYVRMGYIFACSCTYKVIFILYSIYCTIDIHWYYNSLPYVHFSNHLFYHSRYTFALICLSVYIIICTTYILMCRKMFTVAFTIDAGSNV